MSQLSVSNKYKIHNIWSGAQNAVIPYIKLYYEIRAFLKVLKCKCVYQAAIIRSQSIVLGHNYPACQAEHSLQVWRGQDVPPDDALLEAWSVLLHSVKYWIQRNKKLNDEKLRRGKIIHNVKCWIHTTKWSVFIRITKCTEGGRGNVHNVKY